MLCKTWFCSHSYCAVFTHIEPQNLAGALAQYGLILGFFILFTLENRNNTLFYIESRNVTKEYWTHRIMHTHKKTL